MIIRILTEGQFDVDDSHLDRLNELDGAVEQAVEAGNEETFRAALEALLAAVREWASPHELESFDTSDLILPPSDATMDEVREMLADDGLIPG